MKLSIFAVSTTHSWGFAQKICLYFWAFAALFLPGEGGEGGLGWVSPRGQALVYI